MSDSDWIGPVLDKHAINRALAHDRRERPVASTRCKFRCNSVLPINPAAVPTGVIVNLSAVMSDDPESENGKFWTATPSGQTTLWISNPDGAAIFEQGKDYYVDFTPASTLHEVLDADEKGDLREPLPQSHLEGVRNGRDT